MHGVAVYSANMAKLPRSKASLHSRAARERGRTFFRGVANNTPYYGCCTLSGLSSESKARSFSQKLNVVHASLREWGLLSASATWSIRPLGKSTASYTFLYLYYHIGILLYWRIYVLSYCSQYLLSAIRLYIFSISIFLFPFLMFNLNFFSIGCAVNHHRQLFNVQRYGSPGRHQTPVDALPIGEDFLQQTSAIRDWVFYKKSLPIVWLTALLGCHLLKHVKRLRWWRLCRNDSKKNLGLNETESP